MRWEKILAKLGWRFDVAINYWIHDSEGGIIAGGPGIKVDIFFEALSRFIQQERMQAYLDGFLDGQVKKDASQAWIESNTRNEVYDLLHKAQCFRAPSSKASSQDREALVRGLRKNRVVRGVREADAEQADTGSL